MTQVTLAVYDLTQGMAAIMSESILGERIDGIWHTGIRAFGFEWFFGGGIQTLPVGVFEQTRGLPVSRLDEMGVTTKTEAELRSFILTLHNRFNVQTYNLLANNCNNFSDEICKFLCGHGISPDVIELPNRIFSTPNGAMLRPIVESMTNNINGFPHTMDPFANMASSASSGAQAGIGPNGAYASASASTNMAGINLNFGSTHTSGTITHGSDNSRSIAQGTVISEATSIPKAKLEADYLVSAAVQGYEPMGKRLLKIVGDEGKDAPLIESIMDTLSRKLESTDSSGSNDSTAAAPKCAFEAEQYSLLMKLVASNPAAQSAAFFLLRLMVPFKSSDLPEGIVGIVILPLLSMLQKAAPNIGEESFPAPFKNVSSVVFGLITLSNWCSEDRLAEFQANLEGRLEEGLVDMSMTFMHYDKPEVRQIATALCHNLTLRRTSSSSGWINDPAALATQILCGALDDVSDEQDDLVRKRRLSVVLTIVRSSQPSSPGTSDGNTAAQMILDLGFDAVVEQTGRAAAAQSRTGGGGEDPSSEATICRELLSYLRPTVYATAGTNPLVPGVAVN